MQSLRSSISRMGWTGMVLALAALWLGGCDNSLKKQNAALWDENKELRGQLSQTREALDASDAHRAELNSRLADLQKGLNTSSRAAAVTEGNPPNWGEVEVTETAQKVTVRLPGDVLFASGSATLRDSSRQSLDQIAVVINRDYAGKQVRVNGHSDNDPIRRSKWTSNQELSEHRALAVKNYLSSRGVAPGRITTTGHGESSPRVPNTTLANKAINRRVEIEVIK